MTKKAARGFVAVIAGLAAILSAAWASADAKFRVTDAKWAADGKTLDVKIAWALNGYTQDKGGQTVKFVIHNQMPAYSAGANGTPVGTVKMKEGTGVASLKLDAAKFGLKPGTHPVLVGLWKSGHKWGMDDGGRKGGQFAVPAAKPAARPAAKPAAKPTAKPAQGAGQATQSGAVSKGRSAAQVVRTPAPSRTRAPKP